MLFSKKCKTTGLSADYDNFRKPAHGCILTFWKRLTLGRSWTLKKLYKKKQYLDLIKLKKCSLGGAKIQSCIKIALIWK